MTLPLQLEYKISRGSCNYLVTLLASFTVRCLFPCSNTTTWAVKNICTENIFFHVFYHQYGRFIFFVARRMISPEFHLVYVCETNIGNKMYFLPQYSLRIMYDRHVCDVAADRSVLAPAGMAGSNSAGGMDV